VAIVLRRKGVGKRRVGTSRYPFPSGPWADWAAEVAEVDEHLRMHRVAIDGVGVAPARLRYTRIFHVDDLDAPTAWTHGRWYSRFQDLDGAVRGRATVDGSPCVELDISGCQMRILAHRAGIELDGDPYSFPGSRPRYRSAYKKLAMCMMNAADRATGEAAFRLWVQEGNAPGLRVDETIRRMEAALPMAVRPWLFADAGRYTMTVDADICRGILLRSVDRGFPVISIHDGHLTPVKHEADLHRAICEAWADVFPGRAPAMKRTAADGTRIEVTSEYYAAAPAAGGRE
jgi:hypothetical protein